MASGVPFKSYKNVKQHLAIAITFPYIYLHGVDGAFSCVVLYMYTALLSVA